MQSDGADDLEAFVPFFLMPSGLVAAAGADSPTVVDILLVGCRMQKTMGWVVTKCLLWLSSLE